MKAYRIKNWDELYENHETRKLKKLSWVPIPNKHDGEGYGQIWERPDAAELFSAFVLILQVASKCPRRGLLVSKDGMPITPKGLSLKTKAPESIFVSALQVLADGVGWIEEIDLDEISGESPGIPGESPGTPGKTAAEGKGREGKGREQKGTEVSRRKAVIGAKEYDVTLKGLQALLPDWPSSLVSYYHGRAGDYSKSSGATYKDWVAAIRNWRRRDEAEGNGPFKNKKQTASHKCNQTNYREGMP